MRTENVKFMVEDVYSVNGVGLVITGTQNTGTVHKGDRLMIGPIDGIFREVQIRSIHNNYREFVDKLEAGCSGCFCIKAMEKKFSLKRPMLRRGMLLISFNDSKHVYKEFEAKVKILHHPTTIKQNYETIIHCGSIRQVAKIVSMEQKLMRTGDQSVVKFRFKSKPEFIQKDKQIIFREGKTKGIGVVTKVLV